MNNKNTKRFLQIDDKKMWQNNTIRKQIKSSLDAR